ncbi:hypothetical protein ABW19_dt0201914 [Dactylella cylindrospora]|nr:hypothetical protein ABW19_dt0201914 [Dactylella cylindrospora]
MTSNGKQMDRNEGSNADHDQYRTNNTREDCQGEIDPVQKTPDELDVLDDISFDGNSGREHIEEILHLFDDSSNVPSIENLPSMFDSPREVTIAELPSSGLGPSSVQPSVGSLDLNSIILVGPVYDDTQPRG